MSEHQITLPSRDELLKLIAERLPLAHYREHIFPPFLAVAGMVKTPSQLIAMITQSVQQYINGKDPLTRTGVVLNLGTIAQVLVSDEMVARQITSDLYRRFC